MVVAGPELTAEDYEYRLPDHWFHHYREPDSLFAQLHGLYSTRVAQIIKECGAKTVLEVGCGDGWICAEMAKAGLEVVGVDWSRRAVQFASMFVENAKFYQGDARDPEFINRFPNRFDAIALVEVLEHIPPRDCVSAIINMAAPLKSGGTFVLTTPSVNSPNTNAQHYRHFTESILRDLARDSGLIVKSIEGYGDVLASTAYWAKMRWVENRYYSIKPLVRYLTQKYHHETKLLKTPLARCQGFIVTMAKP